MSQRKIFLSCVNRELRSYRLKAELIIQRRGYKPIFEEIFELDDQTALDTIKSRIAECDAVICLVGQAYGGEPRRPPIGEPRRSFTQWEYFLALELGKPIYRLATDPKETPTDDQTVQPPLDPEDGQLVQLQTRFRALILDDMNSRKFNNVDQMQKELLLLRFPWEADSAQTDPSTPDTSGLPYALLGAVLIMFAGGVWGASTIREQWQVTSQIADLRNGIKTQTEAGKELEEKLAADRKSVMPVLFDDQKQRLESLCDSISNHPQRRLNKDLAELETECARQLLRNEVARVWFDTLRLSDKVNVLWASQKPDDDDIQATLASLRTLESTLEGDLDQAYEIEDYKSFCKANLTYLELLQSIRDPKTMDRTELARKIDNQTQLLNTHPKLPFPPTPKGDHP